MKGMTRSGGGVRSRSPQGVIGVEITQGKNGERELVESNTLRDKL